MHFGEYLVQRKILSAHQILKALAEQRRQRAFVPLLLVELDALADFRALNYYTEAEQNNEHFLDVLQRKNVISQAQGKQIQARWMRSGPPLGRLLVELGMMNEATREEVLEEFEAAKALEKNLAKLL